MTDEKEEKIEVAVRVTSAIDPIDGFLPMWRSLPPLVRASLAGTLVKQRAGSVSHLNQEAQNYKLSGLERRAQVATSFANAERLLYDFFVALCKEADDQAEKTGLVNLDTGGVALYYKAWKTDP